MQSYWYISQSDKKLPKVFQYARRQTKALIDNRRRGLEEVAAGETLQNCWSGRCCWSSVGKPQSFYVEERWNDHLLKLRTFIITANWQSYFPLGALIFIIIFFEFVSIWNTYIYISYIFKLSIQSEEWNSLSWPDCRCSCLLLHLFLSWAIT